MPVKFMNESGFAFHNVSSILILEDEGTPGICKIEMRDGDENGERLGTLVLDSKVSTQFIFPVQANGRNFDPNDGVYLVFIQGGAELTITGDND
jgi:hypothetical protein